MSKENTYAVLDCPAFTYFGQDYTLTKEGFVTHPIYATRIKIKTGTAAELIDRQDEALERGFPLQLEFYSPHGLVTQAPIFRLGQIQPGELCEKVEVFVALTNDQVLALTTNPENEFALSGY